MPAVDNNYNGKRDQSFQSPVTVPKPSDYTESVTQRVQASATAHMWPGNIASVSLTPTCAGMEKHCDYFCVFQCDYNKSKVFSSYSTSTMSRSTS